MGKVEKIADIPIYIQDVLGGPNATVIDVAQASIPSNFGLVRVVDAPLTVGPDPRSHEYGRVQGFLSNADKGDSSVCMNLVFIFKDGEYKGSTLSVVGRRSFPYGCSEMAVVGGTGVFRGAEGFTVANSYSHDAAMVNFVMRYDMHVVYVVEE